MSDRKLFGVLSGTQLTILVALAITTPGAVYAIATTAVAVTDPLSGKQAAVDAGRRLYVYDPIAGYANNPLDLLEISGLWGSVSSSIIYTVPAGKALILKTINMSYYGGVSGNDNYAYVAGPNGFIGGFDDTNPDGAHVTNLGSGYYLHSGDTISVSASNGANTNFITEYSIEGYLVPSAAVPALGTPESAVQMINHGMSRKKS